MGMMIGPSY